MEPFKTMEWIRQVRDQHYELFKDKTTEERIAFYREGARRVHERAKPELEAKKSNLNLNKPSEREWQFCHYQPTLSGQEKANTTMLKKLRIYVDTSVIGGCFDPEFATWSNGLFKDFEKGLYQPVLSETVAFEIDRAPSRVIEKYFELLSYQVEIVEITPEVVALADLYVARNILTEKCYDDATHIALATIHHIDTLVSWNFRHIVHWEKMRLFNAVNVEKGYQTVSIHTPREVSIYGRV